MICISTGVVLGTLFVIGVGLLVLFADSRPSLSREPWWWDGIMNGEKSKKKPR